MYRGILIVGGIAIAVGFGLIIFKGKMEEDSELQHQHEAEERTLRSVWDGKLLYQKTWEPTGPPRALLYVAHGVGEHMGRYEKLGRLLAENGILMYGHDHVGHGQSEGHRVHVETFRTYIEDVIQDVEQMKEQYPDTPSLLMGHSMGGLIAAHTALHRQDLFIGLLLSAPSTDVDPREGTPFLRFLARVLALFCPRVGVKAVNPEHISSIPEEVTIYVEDPLVYHGALKAGWGVAFMDSVDELRPLISKITLPLFIMHGREDGLIPLSASQLVFDNTGSQDKIFEVFEDNRHEVLHDRGQERARQLIKNWVLDRLSPPTQQEPQEQQKEEREEQAKKTQEQPEE